MSGISRLLRWAPCLWAVSRLVSSSGQTSRSQLLNTQSASQHPSAPTDLLNTLSFPARTVVKHTPVPRPATALRSPRLPTSAYSEKLRSSAADHDRSVSWMVRLVRTRRPLVRDGWQWDNPYRLSIRMAHKALSISSAILSQVRGICFGRPLPIELQKGILLTVRHPVRTSGHFGEGDMLLVSKHWYNLHRQHFWKKRWLNLRPNAASWSSIAERIQTLTRNADIIHNVKLQGVLTDIQPTSLEQALSHCSDLARIAICDITRVKIGKLDNLNEVLLKQILLHHQDKIRHFDFRAGETPFFLGRRSLFAGSVLVLPKVHKITVDISNIEEMQLLEDLHGNSAGLVAFFIAELVGRHEREQERQVEVRVFCMPEVEEGAISQITPAHVLLAAQIYDFSRALLERVAGLKLVVSFQGPLRAQVAHNLAVLRIWARENSISLINA
ncbi:uncharacterized protein SPSC_03533 [Sporisorium scitamineum]|uniref:F-box domain-containing protein n=1 Tax=Sporisorium scitamineum TaxID=49012 RepID=A0A0F7SAQ6_9BASI|nr:uncharacterized protein SPSC_03533 [Sporisorium scitamineum]CDW97778.1 hypothetical protein [Sporisorium scitamineum]